MTWRTVARCDTGVLTWINGRQSRGGFGKGIGKLAGVKLTRAPQINARCNSFCRGKPTVALVIPWLLAREYQQHRNLDYYGLPEKFEEWRDIAKALNEQLSRVTGRRVVKVVIHPGELEEWARRKGRAVSAQVRSDFAGTLWRTENAYAADSDFRVRSGAD